MSSIQHEATLSTRHASMREVVSLASPIILSMISMSILGLVDTLFMRWVSPAAQAAIGVGAPSTFSVLALFLGCISGLTTFVSQYFGAKRYHECGKMLWITIDISFILGIFAIFAVIPAVGALLATMGTNSEILNDTFNYMRWRIYGAPFVFIGYALLSYLRGLGDMKTPAITSIITIVANVPLTYIFVFGMGPIPACGAAGAAIGTILAQAIETLCYAFVVFNKKNHATFNTRHFTRPTPDDLKTFFKLSLPIGLSWAIEHVGWLFFGLYISSLDKESAAAHAIVSVFMNLCFMPGLALSIAATTLTGQYLGANNPKTAEKSAYICMKLAIGILISISILIVFARYAIAGAFSDDPKVIHITANLFCFGIVYQVFDAIGVTTGGALRGAGDTRFPMFIMMFCMWVIMIPLIFLFGIYLGWGVYGAWTAFVATCVLIGICNFTRFRIGRWKNMGLA